MKFTHRQAVWMMVLITFLWSTAGVVTRHLEAARSFEVTFWRSAFTVLSLLVLLPLFKGRDVFAKIRHAPFIFWVSALCWCGMFTFFMMALMMTSVANVLVTMSIGPLLTALFSRIFLGSRIANRTWIAIAAAGVGIAWMYAAQMSQASIVGTLVALGVPISGALNWTVTQHAHSRGQDLDLMPAVLVGGVLSCLITLPLALPLQATAHDLVLLAGLGLGQLAIPCLLVVICSKVLAAPELSLLSLLEVLFGIFLAWVGAGETPDKSVLVGGSLVIGALVFNEWLAGREQV